MIRLTLKSNGNPIYIAPENITAICDNKEGGAEVYSDHDFSLVRETSAEVARKVLEYRLAMEGYRIFTKRASIDGDYDVANSHYDELKRLAGLEEPKDE